MPTDNQVARMSGQRRRARFFFLKRETSEQSVRRREKTNLQQRHQLEKLEPQHEFVVGKHGEVLSDSHDRRDKKGK